MKVTLTIECDDITDLLNHLDAIKGQINQSARNRRLMGDSDMSPEMASEVNSNYAADWQVQGKHKMTVK